ncbi:Nucleoside transporter family [Talaromyces stipitatus ATCC 10500]|uniref:Nucleoside transporter family n=1 Tax=Talaromyces stipitatus (strain ATCC 10500 / CBS 375.48 / QM 6759 / NRRL 1006) TaxID=441959 RepID=B8MKU2_TALSN|nr:Nucleoside transporter family [Talaromyces stipitatus ATCC 10500]EED14941.1 Nucleoside transporter family [Talaromyces stipitatus ATCC 10500]
MSRSLLSRVFPSTISPEYEPVENDELLGNAGDGTRHTPNATVSGEEEEVHALKKPFSWHDYTVFLLLGVAMLWAWNMFLAAAPYFHRRFQQSPWAVEHYESSIVSVSTVTNLLCVLVLAKLQRNASYPIRIAVSLVILTAVFALQATSTAFFRTISIGMYFIFVMTMVLGASFAVGMNQNGVFAYVSGFGRPEYTQAIMAGQGIAGVLPCIVQIITNAAESRRDDENDDDDYYKPALTYFLFAVVVTLVAFFAFLGLMNRTAGSRWFARELRAIKNAPAVSNSTESQTSAPAHKTVGLWRLFLRLKWLALAVFLCFTVTMVYPVFTVKIQSVHDPATRSRIFEPELFVPLAFLFWNLGDLIGRMSPIIPALARSANYPRALFAFSVLRLVFIPMYLACNIQSSTNSTNSSAIISSDFFYLFVVQLGFGLTNGFLGSVCMMGTSQYVTADEREAAGGFMSMMLVAGLAAGSLTSFLFTGA